MGFPIQTAGIEFKLQGARHRVRAKFAAVLAAALLGLAAVAQASKPALPPGAASIGAKAEEAFDPFKQGLATEEALSGKSAAPEPKFAAAFLNEASEDLTELRAKAEEGDGKAQLLLGSHYLTGSKVAKDVDQGLKWIRRAAEQGDEFAQFALGHTYARSDYVPKDTAEAVVWYRKAAEQGYVLAQNDLGEILAEGDGVPKDLEEAAKWLRLAAEQGWAEAQFRFAEMCIRGDGVPKDTGEAAKWFCKLAERGDACAQYALGVIYAKGEGVPKWSGGAVTWFRRAAEQGHPSAQNALGVMYNLGNGVPKDEIEALAWYNIAAASGDTVGIKNRDGLERFAGREVTLLAQQRSRQIMKEIEATKNAADRKDDGRAGGGRSGGFSLDADASWHGIRQSAVDKPKVSGTGAIVSRTGHVLTAAHLVTGAVKVNIRSARGAMAATIERVDEANDLAVLKIAGGEYVPLPVVPSRNVRLGQAVATIGFPNTGIQGLNPKVTRGEISSLNGAGDDPRSWQISVPVQVGNSGGPLLDECGNILGVVVAKLGLRAAAATGDLPQNVNYAVKSAYALALLEPFLDANAPVASTQKRSFEDMIAKAQQSVVLVLVH